MSAGVLGRHRAHGCRLYGSTAQSFPDNVQTAVALAGVSWDTDGYTGTTPSYAVVPAGMEGRYQVRGAIGWGSVSTLVGQHDRYLELDVNGNFVGSVWVGEDVSDWRGGPTGDLAVLQTFTLAAGDDVHLEAFQASGADRSAAYGDDGGTFLELVYLGR